MPGSRPGALHCALHGGDAWDRALALHRRGPTAAPRPGASELIVRRQLGPGAVSREKVPGIEPTMALPSKGMYLLLRTIVVLGLSGLFFFMQYLPIDE